MLIKKLLLYLLLFTVYFISACQKQNIVGSNDYKSLGTSAHNLLVNSPYSLLQIEINYMPGYAPDTATINNLTVFLKGLINKSVGIQVVTHQIAASQKMVLTLSDIVAIEKKNRTIFSGNDVIAVHILIADADFSDGNVLGKSYWNTSTCLFGKTIEKNSGGFGQVSKIKLYTTIAEHEFGHLLGLVNQGSPMQQAHQDITNGAHCNNKNCLMFYNIETTAPTLFLNTIPVLDANCLADLKANGGR